MNRRSFIDKLFKVSTTGLLLPKVSYFFFNNNPLSIEYTWKLEGGNSIIFTPTMEELIGLQIEKIRGFLPVLFNTDNEFYESITL